MTLAETGPFDKFLVLGPATAGGVIELLGQDGRPRTVQTATVSGRALEAWPIGPGETLLLLQSSGSRRGGTAAEIAGRIAKGDASVIDVGSAWTILQLNGSAAPAVLAELLTVDVDPQSLAPGSIVQGQLGGVRSIVARRHAHPGPEYVILVPREYAMYCWEALTWVGAAHGLPPIAQTEAAG